MEIAALVLSNRLAQLGLAIMVGYGWGWWSTDASWRAYQAKQQAAQEVLHQMELAREAANARAIAEAATRRVEEDTAELSKLRRQVADFDKGETNAKVPCVMDDVFIDAAHKLRFTPKARRPAKVARPPK